jgi:hypothetical protein
LFFLVSTLFFFGPLHIFLTNAGEFDFGLKDILPRQALAVIIIFAFTAVALRLVPGRLSRFALVFSAAVSFLFWMQGQVIVWSYGPLNGQDIVWSNHVLKGVIDSALWIAVLALAVVFRRALYPRLRPIAIFFILLQAGLLLALFLKNPAAWSSGRSHSAAPVRVDFSPEKNVLLLVLDEFQSDVFAEIIGREPGSAALFDGFTYFKDCVGSYMCTSAAIPFIMTGQYYYNNEPRSGYLRRAYASHSIPQVLEANGFRSDMVTRPGFADTVVQLRPEPEPRAARRPSWRTMLPDQAFLVDIAWFRCAPHFVKPLVYRRQDWLLSRWARRLSAPEGDRRPSGREAASASGGFKGFGRELVQLNLDFGFVNRFHDHADLSSPEPVFKYYHWNAVHVPLRFDENFRIVYRESNRASYTSQAKACLKMVRIVLDKLKELGVYDRTLVIILSDHGSGRTPDMFVNPVHDDYSRFLANGDPHGNFHFSKSRGAVLLLVKPFLGRGVMKTSLAPVSHLDVAPTIFSELGIDARDFSGESVFTVAETDSRKRFFYAFRWDGDHNEFLQPLVEYAITGNCWNDASWDRTGRIFTASRH